MSPQSMAGILGLVIAIFLLSWLLFGSERGMHRQVQSNLKRGLQPVSTAASGRGAHRNWRTVVGRLTPPAARGYLEKLLVKAGRPAGWPLERVIAAKVVLAVGFGLLGFLLYNVMRSPLGLGIAIFLTLLGFFLPELRLYSQGIERRQAISLQLPDTLDQMSIAVQAGLGFDAAMVRVARNGKGELARELIRSMQDIQVGQPRRIAYTDLGERCGVPELRRFMRAIVQAETYGLALSDVLHTQADEMRIQRRQRAEAKAMEIPVKVVFPLILCILPVIFIVLLGPAGIRIMEAFSNLGR